MAAAPSLVSFRPKGEIVELRAYQRQRERLLDTAAGMVEHREGRQEDEERQNEDQAPSRGGGKRLSACSGFEDCKVQAKEKDCSIDFA